MPIITTPLKRNDTGQAVADLQTALLKLGSPIADIEKTAKRFGDSTLAAVIDLRKQFGLPEVNGNLPPFDASVGRLLNVAASANDGNLTALRSAGTDHAVMVAEHKPKEAAFDTYKRSLDQKQKAWEAGLRDQKPTIWTTLEVHEATSKQGPPATAKPGATLTINKDGSIFASGSV